MLVRKQFSTLLLSMVVLTVIGCSGQKEAPTAKDQAQPAAKSPPKTIETSIAVAGRAIGLYAPLALAENGTYFKDEGLVVKAVELQSSTDSVQALISGTVDFAGLAMDHVVKSQIQGTELVMIHLITNATGQALVVDSRYKDQIKTVADLRGKKVGVSSVGSGMHTILTQILKANGMDAGAVDVRPVGITTMPDKLLAGDVVASMGTDPELTGLVKSGKGFILYDVRTLKDTQALYNTDYPFIGIVTRRDLLKKNPELVKRVAAGMLKSQQYLIQTPATESALKIPAQLKGSDVQLYTDSLEVARKIYSVDGQVSQQGFDTVVRVMKEQKAVGGDQKLQLSQVYVKP